MAKSKKAVKKAAPKKAAKKKAAGKRNKRSSDNDVRQAWERGISFPCAKNEVE